MARPRRPRDEDEIELGVLKQMSKTLKALDPSARARILDQLDGDVNAELNALVKLRRAFDTLTEPGKDRVLGYIRRLGNTESDEDIPVEHESPGNGGRQHAFADR